MATITLPQNNSRTALQATSSVSGSNIIYPTDLTGLNSNRNMYMLITLNNYNSVSVTSPPSITPYTQIALPVPFKINDQTTVNWEQASTVAMGASAASSILSGLGPVGKQASRALGSISSISNTYENFVNAKTYNPFMVMLFKTQNFKEHVLQWIFAPNNQQDTNTLHNIIEYFKAAMLPSLQSLYGISGLGLGYPDIATIAFNVPTDNNGNQQPYLFNFKPCAITSAFLDWSGAGVPAFFSDGSPAIVSLTLQLKEIELWFRTGQGTYA